MMLDAESLLEVQLYHSITVISDESWVPVGSRNYCTYDEYDEYTY